MKGRVNLKDIPNLAGVEEVIVAQRKWRKNVGDFPKKSVPGSIPTLPSRVDLENTADKIRLKLLASGISSDSRSARSQFQGHHIWLNLVPFLFLHDATHFISWGIKDQLRFRPNKFFWSKNILLMICYPPFILFSILQADFQTQSSRICLRK